MKHLILILILLFSFILGGCDTENSSDDNNNTDNYDVIKSEQTREMNPNPTQSDLDALVQNNTEFALDLYFAFADDPSKAHSNLFFSPFSISEALAMAWAGARNNTESEMSDTLHFFADQSIIHPTFNALDLYLMSLGNSNPEEFRLKIVNAIWGQDGFPFLQEFLDVLAINYGAGMNILDFIADPEAARLTINEWVEEQTEEKIKDLLPQGSITQATALVLTNAIYFKADWLSTFDSTSTVQGDFEKLNGSTVNVDFMTQNIYTNYFEGNGIKAIELPYKGNQTSMIIIYPADLTNFTTFEASLDSTVLNNIISSMSETNVNLTIPKFSFTSSLNLKKYLQTLGMNEAFSDTSDFSGIDGNKDLFISGVLHKAFIAVNEEGTEAAAATGVIFENTAIPANIMNVNSPFIFLIREKQYGTILFLGRLVNP